MSELVCHTIDPIYDKESRILILGTLPSVKSREHNFYYSHPQNRFWKVVASILGCSEPLSIDEKKQMLIKNKIALWDVIESCTITGSSDSSIKNAKPNNITSILMGSNIRSIYGNGQTAYQLYQKLCYPNTHMEMIKLPSTSPANASYDLERLTTEWKVILKSL